MKNASTSLSIHSKGMMKYRADIDGLRAISVIAVIIFHSGFDFLAGGYVGVDVFFVISGFLITGLIYDEIQSNTFTISGFYKRRIARLLPALCITLFVVLLFGFIFYDNYTFDNLGKEVFFSALGAANILFGQGVNYFAQEESVRPIIHLWSLGVEEQFYFIWPALLLALASLKLKNTLMFVAALFAISFYLAVVSNEIEPVKTYFYPQYRAFELLIGAMTALVIRHHFFHELKVSGNQKELISVIAIFLIVIPMFLLDENSIFPGLNTLWPCVGTALFIAFSHNSRVSRVLGLAPLVFLGLISYPLYLYHQPIISYLHFFNLGSDSVLTFFIVLATAIPLSWITYQYVEKPIRRVAHRREKPAKTYVIPLTASLALFAVVGILIAKNDGFEARFKVLNPFAYEVSRQSAVTFGLNFPQGFNVSEGEYGKILFIGDSLLQQYVYPMAKALDLNNSEVDTVARGGCVLLKNVQFQDEFADISCNGLRDQLYKINKRYDYVVISQSWNEYDKSILNSQHKDTLKKWEPFIEDTIKHFKPLAKNIILIGAHLKVDGTSAMSPTILLSQETYQANLNHLKVFNFNELEEYRSFFDQWHRDGRAIILQPIDIWYQNGAFVLHDQNWSFFIDMRHISNASTEYVIQRFTERFHHINKDENRARSASITK